MARVLLIDDDLDLREALGEWLTLHGHSVESVGQARDAAEAARRFAPDVILLDGLLPDGRGADVLEELEVSAPVVFISGLGRQDLPSEARVVEKPLDLERLERTLRELVPARA
jgi:two-component system OmpR family response regulator